MALLDLLQKQMVDAMKQRDEARLNALRMVKAALMKHKVDTMKELTESEELKVLNTLIKQRKEAADMFRQGGRIDQAEKEEAEQRMIEGFMPAAPSEEEMIVAIEAAKAETGVSALKQMGVVVKAAQAKLAGKRVDGKALADLVRSRLS